MTTTPYDRLHRLTELADVLYQDAHTLVLQTHASHFDAGDDLYGRGNVALHVGDDATKVLRRRAILLDVLAECGIEAVHWLNQVHGNQAVSTWPLTLAPKDADALITEHERTALAIMTADCVPIALFAKSGNKSGNKPNDQSNAKAVTSTQPIACIHAGHPGLTNGVIGKTVDSLQAMRPFAEHDFAAVIGACISQTHYEIDSTLGQCIVTTVCERGLVAIDASTLTDQIIKPVSAEKCYLDVRKLARLQLERYDIDVLAESKACSYATANLYSYRRQTHQSKSGTGRMAMLVARLS